MVEAYLPAPTLHSCCFRMFQRKDFSGEARVKLRTELRSLGEGVRTCVDRVTSNGLTARAIAPLVRVAGGLSPSLPQLNPLVRCVGFCSHLTKN